MKNIGVAFLVFFSLAVGENNKRLTIEDVIGHPPFRSASLGRYLWFPGEDAILVKGKDSWNKIDFITNDTTVFLTREDFNIIHSGNKPNSSELDFLPSHIIFNKTGNKILFRKNAKRIWRHSSAATYFVLNLDTKEIIQVSKNNINLRNVKFSPDGRKLAYVRSDNNLYVFNMVNGKEKQLSRTGSDHILNGHFGWVYEEEFGSYDGYRWSPDSKSIAFWEENQSEVPVFTMVDELDLYPKLTTLHYPKAGQKNPKMKIGVVSIFGGRTKWMDILYNSDSYYPWMKWTEKNELVIMRMNRLQNEWTFLLTNPKRSKSKIGLKESDEQGWVDLHRNYYFLKNGKILWISERTGWQHLFIHSKDGTEEKQITSGNWEVTKIVHVDEKKNIIYFMANKKDMSESHLYSIHMNGENLNLLTPEKGSHSISFSSTGNCFIDSYSSFTQPRKIVLRDTTGKIVNLLKETNREQYDEYNWSFPQLVQFNSGDDAVSLNGVITLPPDFVKGKPYPVIVNGYGMPGTQIVRNYWGGSLNQYFAQNGFITFSMDSRGMSGRGEAFKNLSYGNMGHYLAKDHAAGVKWLVEQGYADPNRIGAWGWSGGGYFTGLMLTKNADYFQVGVAVAPVMDFRLYDSIYTERYMGLPEDNEAGYDSSSVFSYVDRFKGKLLVMHGTGDDNVHAQNTTQLIEEFVKKDKSLDVFLYPNRPHSMSGGNARKHLFRKLIQYFENNL